MVSSKYETIVCTKINKRRNQGLESRATFTISFHRSSQSDFTQKPLAIHAFHQEGLACLVEKSHARHDQAPTIDEVGCARLLELVRLSPRTFGHDTSVWTRPLLAQQLHQEGHTASEVSATSISNALGRVGISWRRAKQWIHSPDPHYEHRKKDGMG